MLIFALETATKQGSVALWADGRSMGQLGDPSASHAERLPNVVTGWLGTHGHRLSDVDLFAVVTGPGSFTGLRVGLASIQGFALPSGRRVVGVPTLDAIAVSWQLGGDGAARVVACADGQRGDVFVAIWDVDPSGPTARLGTPLAGPIAVAPGEVAGLVTALGPCDRTVIVGDGAVRYQAELRLGLPTATVTTCPRPLAEGAAWIAADRAREAAPPDAVQPTYLRRPDVELARERRSPPAEPAAPVFRVRLARGANDLSAVEALQARTFTRPWSGAAMQWELEHTQVARLFVLDGPDGTVWAYCACWIVVDELHINSLAVDPDHRRKGVGRHLLGQVLTEAVRQGARLATLEVRASNEPARRLYEDQGFVVEGVRRDYYQDPREDALILWHRQLPNSGSESR